MGGEDAEHNVKPKTPKTSNNIKTSTKGSLEVKLPIIWAYDKQRREESEEKVREEKRREETRRSKKRKSEEVRSKKMQVREKI